MKPAPGSQLPIEEIFGRDSFINELWNTLERNSVRMEAERRIGKTSILRKMAAEPPKSWEPISLDVEKVHSADEFAELVCKEAHKRLTNWGKKAKRLWEYLERITPKKWKDLIFPEKKDRPDHYWKTLLIHTIEDLVEQQGVVNKRVVFLFDEMPWMLSAIADPERDGPQVAMEVLDVLRSLRQDSNTGQGFRMVLCGSIGMHHILGSLKQQGYKNQPVNDMMLVEVPPLEPNLATELANQLLIGAKLTSDSTVPKQITEQTGGFPYYIHWVVSKLNMTPKQVLLGDIDRVVKQLLTDAHDPFDLHHFRKRIEGYYPKEEKFVLALLDHTAKNTNSITQAELINVAKSVGTIDDDSIRELLRLLTLDHYLIRDTDGRYGFRHDLLRRWWVLDRGLSV